MTHCTCKQSIAIVATGYNPIKERDPMANPTDPILDPSVNAVIDRLEAARHRPADGWPLKGSTER
ncbi:MAG TPA: hypothetical protein VMV15_05275 [Candidatus Binataceae bacterium]|nr:hypothetical protein [Candidatus Binataceae bacterium]